jgi:hypothetical protein
MKRIVVILYCAGAVFPSLAAAPNLSSYAGQESREIKALSPEEVNGISAGKGMGLAKTAELNGYPGPAHVLELSSELKLSEQQRRQTEVLFRSMQRDAVDVGNALLAEERTLDQAFAVRTITPQSLQTTLARIGQLQSRLRVVHLEAHLEQDRILTPQQNAEYARLRGYDAQGANAEHTHQHLK